MVKLQGILVWTEDNCLSYGKQPLPACIQEDLRIHWLIKIINLSIILKVRFIREYCIIFVDTFKQNKGIPEKIKSTKSTYNKTDYVESVEDTYGGFDEQNELGDDI